MPLTMPTEAKVEIKRIMKRERDIYIERVSLTVRTTLGCESPERGINESVFAIGGSPLDGRPELVVKLEKESLSLSLVAAILDSESSTGCDISKSVLFRGYFGYAGLILELVHAC